MARNAIVIAMLALMVAGCASFSGRATARDGEPSASVPGGRPLAGHWQGGLWETGGSFYQGSTPIDLRIAEDGAWTGTFGTAEAAGAARLRGDRLILSGTATAPDGTPEAVYLTLKGDDRRRWGETHATFKGREAPAAVSLTRAGGS
jgi:hypothetical protein